MKKSILFAFLLLLGLYLFSCYPNNEEYTSNVENIPINLSKSISSPMEEAIEKIELIPLETNNDCLFHLYRKMEYYNDLELFAILDINYIVFLFSKDGKYIANSKELRGQGPRQFQILSDFLYNPYSKCMEFLDPWGTIYRYDTSFNFIEKISLEQKKIVFDNFFPLNKTQYLLTIHPFYLTDLKLYFCDFDNKRINTIDNHKNFYIGGPSMQNQFFFQFDDQLLFLPVGLDYHFYIINSDSLSIMPVIKLDFGKDEITRKQIENMTGISYKDEMEQKNRRNKTETLVINKALIESSLRIPISKYINDKYVYLQMLTNNKRSNYIYNRKTKKGFYQAIDDEFKIYFGLQLEDNILITMPQPYEIEKYLNIKYMSQRDIEIMEKILEDDNPIIVKYYLK